MGKETEKTLRAVSLAAGAFLLTMLVVVGGTALYRNRDASIDVAPKGWLSQFNSDPTTDNRAAYEKMSREAWEHAKSQQPDPQPPNGWQGGWKK